VSVSDVPCVMTLSRFVRVGGMRIIVCVKRTIAYVNHANRVSGAERSLLALLDGLDRSAWEPVVVCPPDGPLCDEVLSREISLKPLEMVRFRRSVNPARLMRYATTWRIGARALARVLAAISPDLVHANSTIAQCYVAPVRRRMRIPSVWHFRDLRGPAPVLAFAGLRADRIIAISKAVARAIPARVPGSKVRIIHNGIDPDAFATCASPSEAKRALKLADGVPVILMAAQMVPWKGHGDLLHALKILTDRGERFVCLIAGDDLFGDNPEYSAQIRRMCNEMKLEGCARFLGYRKDVPSLMAISDVVVVPSLAEPFGRVALEAMALAKPVVGTDAGGLPEIVRNGETGLLVLPSNSYALADALATLLRDSDRRVAFGREGRRVVEREFHIRTTVELTCHIYEELLDSKVRGGA